MKKKILLVISIIIISLGIGMVGIIKRENSINHLISVVVGKADKSSKEDHYIKSVLQKHENDLNETEKFIVGYEAYLKEDYDKARAYLRTCQQSTNDLMKFYSTIALIKITSSNSDASEYLSLVEDLIKSIKNKTYFQGMLEIEETIQNAFIREDGREAVKHALEHVLENTKGLAPPIIYDLKGKLGVVYFNNGNYANGIEKCLEIIAQSEETGDTYFTAKAYIDLGLTYGLLGHYDKYREYIEKGLNTPIENEVQAQFIKSYGAINLYTFSLKENDYEKVGKMQDLVALCNEMLTGDMKKGAEISNRVAMINLKLNMGEIEAAEKELAEVEKLLESTEEINIMGSIQSYKSAKAAVLYAKGEVDESIKYYKMELDSVGEGFEKGALEQLIRVLNEQKRYEEANIYEKRLEDWYEKQAATINEDYFEYALYKYNDEHEMKAKAEKELRRNINLIVIGAGILGTISCLLLRYIRLNKLNKSDELTKLYNRSYFEKCYNELLEQKKEFAVIMFDIDHFKSINDTYGHIEGDKVIRKVVELSQKAICKSGTMFRYGGEEFVVLIEHQNRDVLMQLAEGIRSNVEGYEWSRRQVTVSIGVADGAPLRRDILNLADQNLYKAKSQGRNKVVYGE